ncbi:MAG: hypothetical protein IPP64_11680 [Bacteroidetes bacterium]|nr:hypothetical protein [Bacteroidota bacterium]
MKSENKVLINIIGTGYDVCVCEVPSLLLDQLNLGIAKEERSLGYLLFEDEFYAKYQIPKTDTKNYSTWKDFDNKGVYRGANLSERGQLEIWFNRKRIKTYQFHELINDANLFPLFDNQEQFLKDTLDTNKPNFVVGYQEKGHLSKYRMNIDRFIPEEFQLHILQFFTPQLTIRLLHKITYSGVEVKSLKDDTVITGTLFNWL